MLDVTFSVKVTPHCSSNNEVQAPGRPIHCVFSIQVLLLCWQYVWIIVMLKSEAVTKLIFPKWNFMVDQICGSFLLP